MTILGYKTFLQQAGKVVKQLNKTNQSCALLLIEFENLSELDSLLGYNAVDLMLKEGAGRLAESLLATDLVATIGRHQLACLLYAPPTSSHAELAGHKVLRLLNKPFHHGNRHFYLAARAGISLTKIGAVNSLDELLRQANAAILAAIHEREFLNVYSESNDKLTILKLDLLGDLESAVQESRLSLAYQPQLDLSTNKIVCAEALLRWTHPKHGPILPGFMVHLAERTDLITKLTFWVLNTALRQLGDLHQAGLDISVSINLSAYNLREPDLVDIISEALQLWSIPANRVGLELTETAILDEHTRSLETLYKLKKLGLRIAMDDFGIGYSSISLLGKLPLDEVKIDISFVKEMLKKPQQARIVSSMIDLAHALNMEVVAEGVEDKATCERLRELGCDTIQGYLIGRPLSLTDFIKHSHTFKLETN